MQQQYVALLEQMLVVMKAERVRTIENVHMENGRVTGATVQSSLPTIQ